MTPAQLDHLKLIDAHLERLLAIAEKRTLGEWQQGDSRQEMNMDMVYRKPHAHGQAAGIPTFGRNSGLSREQDEADAAFIALCAGNAEAGWRATRAAIACLLVICDPASGADFTNYGGETFLPQILAAFPLETLNPKKP